MMQALPLPKPPLPVRALTPADGPIPTATEHTPASADRSPSQPLPIVGAHEPRSLPRSPRPTVPQDESPGVQNGLGGAGGANGSGNSTQPPPSRLRSHDSLTGASARPRSRAASDKPEPVQTEGGGSGDAATIASVANAANSNNGNNRPLNVTDALSYLDAVKVQFYDKPDVYNHFLDIMKDFKSQIIDTPGVIERVSMLFHGNPYLIEGFNTFLPPGYHINASADPSLITVTTPLGTVTSKISSGTHSAAVGGPSYGSPHPYVPQTGGSRPDTPLARLHPPQTFSPAPQGLTTAVASVLGNMSNKTQVERAPTAEFDHAIQYLNKIKTRYPDDQNNTYKQFLEILQTYRKEQQSYLKDPVGYQQREQRMMHDVYIQVQALFKDEEDLLSEFKDFLPEIAGTSTQKGGLVGIRPYPLDNSNTSGAMWSHDTAAASSSTPKGTQPPSRRRKREQPKEPPPPPAKQPETTRDSRKRPRVARPATKNHVQSPTFTSYQTPPSPLPGPAHFAQHSQTVSQFGHNLQGHHAAQAGPSSVQSVGSSSPQDELMFFERAKRALEARDVYDDFLKLLNMYTRDIIDLKTLVVRAEKILADDGLLAQFKRLVNWDDRIGNVNYGPPGSIRTGPHDAALPRPVDDAQSPSYRRLPESEIRLATSGRDQLARSVLNDEWVSHPTWASEEAGFVAHKKNSFEEVIHRCEDERHEYQIQLEGLSRTIGILEPLATRLNEMPLGERAALRLRPDLGGQSRWIYVRTLKKVYGKDAGTEVYQALQDAPAVAVPVVLARLKQKNDEWRRAQREWSLTWRQVDARNFYKSLDHTGINCKQNDKKAITTKAFVTEIDNVRTEEEIQERQQLQQKRTRERGAGPNHIRPACARGSLGFQLSYSFADSGVLCDALKLVYSYLDHNQATYSLPERRSVERFLRAFMPVLCMLPPAAFNAACGPPEIGVDDDSGDEQQADDVSARTQTAAGSGSGCGVHAGDLRKKLARAAAHEKNGAGAADVGEVLNTKGKEREKEARRAAVAQGVWIREYLAEGAVDIRDAPVSTRPFFCNTTFYTLLRLLQLLYSRLSSCKEEGRKHARQRFRHLVANPIAVELGMDDPQGPSSVLEQILRDRSTEDNEEALYQYMLEACEKLFMNELDQATFEEHMRWFFGTKAFLLYTVDKIVASLIKQVQTIVSDNKCQELWQFLRRHRSEVSFTRQDIIKYRRKAEHHVGADDNLYRVEWKPGDKSLHIQLMGPGEASVDDARTPVNRWREYVDSYVTEYPTEWIQGAGHGQQPRLFVRRNVTFDDGLTCSMEGELGIRISLGTYRLFHESGTEWTLTRSRGREEERMLKERARQREEDRRRRVGAIILE
ncbi:hypothetical protein EDB92DRAFT_1857823 [Lactarius akahatsu]|uniref:Histone deacetylase interacting domain-containing protein n=1 Tax=Lactarius akahatsu TaxID=416441 RepID=A0AAD4LL32_9AGAM|nr:hypothetical protein EDB92DRAFT_1857823 [Lactarius akahatsu]